MEDIDVLLSYQTRLPASCSRPQPTSVTQHGHFKCRATPARRRSCEAHLCRVGYAWVDPARELAGERNEPAAGPETAGKGVGGVPIDQADGVASLPRPRQPAFHQRATDPLPPRAGVDVPLEQIGAPLRVDAVLDQPLGWVDLDHPDGFASRLRHPDSDLRIGQPRADLRTVRFERIV